MGCVPCDILMQLAKLCITHASYFVGYLLCHCTDKVCTNSDINSIHRMSPVHVYSVEIF